MSPTYTNVKGHALSVAVWLMDDEYDRPETDGPYYSATDLLNPVRMIVLKERLREQAADATRDTIDIDSLVPSRMGQAIHQAIERAWTRDGGAGMRRALTLLGYPEELIRRIRVNPTEAELDGTPDLIPVFMEKRFLKEIHGVTIGGKFDFVLAGVPEDFKSMKAYGYQKNDKEALYKRQVSIYKWLAPHIITEDFLKVQHIITDFQDFKAGSKDYPPARIAERRFVLHSVEETERWIENRVAEILRLKDVPEAELPWCTPTDLWQKPPVYKHYMTMASKKATPKGVFDDREAAYRFLAEKGTGFIRETPAEVKRCHYCPARAACTQKDALIRDGLLKIRNEYP